MTWAEIGISVPLDRDGGEVQTTCPKCSDSRRKKAARCMSVNLDKGAWYCHHCGYRGSLERGELGPSTPPKRQTIHRPSDLPADVSEEVLRWFASRRIPAEIVRRNGIVSGKAWMPQREAWVEAVWFPYRKAGQIVNVKFRDGQKNFRQMVGAEKVPYGIDDVKDTETVVWVEGEMDKLSMDVAGFPNSLSVPDGAPAPGSRDYTAKFDFLDAHYELFRGQKHVLAVDADVPGTILREELARRLGRERCWLVTWPDGCKDANEVLVKLGAAELVDRIEAAKPYPIEGLYDVDSHSQELESLYDQGWPKTTPAGWLAMDGLYSVRTGEWTVVTGIPGHGKSSFVDALCVGLAMTHEWRFAVFSPENNPLAAHMAKLAEIYTGKPFERGYRQRISRAEFEEAREWLQKHFWFVLPEETYSLDSILDRMRVAVHRHGCSGIVLDPWNEIEHTRDRGITETEYIGRSLSLIRRFARTNGVHVWVVAHPAKLHRPKDGGDYPVPTPYDISGSAHWRNKADNCLCVWRDLRSPEKPVAVHVQKIRFREVGTLGVGLLRFDRSCGRYQDLPAMDRAQTWSEPREYTS